jgi:hypothetical protein
MQYVAMWRMQLASRLLADGGHVAAVAGAVGYEVGGRIQPGVQEAAGPGSSDLRRSTVVDGETV